MNLSAIGLQQSLETAEQEAFARSIGPGYQREGPFGYIEGKVLENGFVPFKGEAEVSDTKDR